MAVKFNDRERAGIVSALRKAAASHAASDGMRKTTVDELAEEAGISKGAFYKFYPSKEHLFLDMLEQWYDRISQVARMALQGAQMQPPRQKAAVMFKAAVRAMRVNPMAGFLRDEAPLLLRKLPEELAREHYESDEMFVRRLVEESGIELQCSGEVAYAAIRILFLSQLTADQAGPGYEAAVDALIDGVVAMMVK